MPRLATERVTRGLRWTGSGLLVAGTLVVVGGIGLTQTVDALVTASAIAVLAFGVPGAAAFALAFWLEHVASELERTRASASQPALTPPPRARNPFREPWRVYAIAVVTVLAAWGARAALDAYIPGQVPFITFYLAVAVAGWAGGFGPAAFATFLSVLIAGALYVTPDLRADAPSVGRFVLLGLFVLVSLGIAAVTSALHEALARTRELAAEAHRRTESAAANENRLRALAQSAPVPLFLADSQQACAYCNQAWLAMRGRTLTQELGHGWWDGVHPEDLPRRRGAFAEALQSRSPASVDYRLRCAGGRFKAVRDTVQVYSDARGEVLGLVGACFVLPEEPHPELEVADSRQDDEDDNPAG
jgi:PAS domain S-box-containing protein